jgi:hypothetical protein
MVVKFDELIVELLLKMHDSPSELPDVSHFIRLVEILEMRWFSSVFIFSKFRIALVL